MRNSANILAKQIVQKWMTSSMTYPRYSNNGYHDDGHRVNVPRSGVQHCPNCGSTSYRETVSLESCDDCGLRFDYWGDGANDVYDRFLKDKYAAERAREEEQDRRQQEEWAEEQNHRNNQEWDSDHDN